MTEENALSELLRKVASIETITCLPTQSSHGQLAKDMLNELIMDHPDWKPAILMLSTYPVQEWASKNRKRLSIDTDTLSELISQNLSHDEFFGISGSNRFLYQKASLEYTDKMLSLITDVLSGKLPLSKSKMSASEAKQQLKVLNAVHGIEKPDVSKFMIQSHYMDAIESFCGTYAKQFKTDVKAMTVSLDKMDEDAKLVYHDTDILIRMMPSIDENRYHKGTDVDYGDVYNNIVGCLNMLGSYPFGGRELMNIAKSYAAGLPEVKIAEQTGKSRTYVRARYKASVDAVSYLIWGYSAREIIRNASNN